MTEQRRNVPGGFVTPQGVLPGLCYVLTEPWRPEFVRVFEQDGAEYLRLNRTLGWRKEPLNFLRTLERLRGVEIYHSEVDDLGPLPTLAQLAFVGLECPFRRLDFAVSFPHLTGASVSWRAGCETLFGCSQLTYLAASKYPHPDLSPLGDLRALTRLIVSSAKLASTGGVSGAKALRRVTFSSCTALRSIEALASLSGLEEIEFSTCKRIEDIEALGSLTRLRRLTIENCGEIRTVRPLAGCVALEELYLIGTTVGDGDLGVLLSLERLRKAAVAKNARHSHSMQQLNAALAARNSRQGGGSPSSEL